jgi:uncharacterized protein YjcR
MKHALPKKTHDAIVRAKGSAAEIAKRYGCSPSLVHKYKLRAGVPIDRYAHLAGKKEKAVEMRKQNIGYIQIGEALGIRPCTAWQWCMNAGLRRKQKRHKPDPVAAPFTPTAQPAKVAPWIRETLARMESAK